MRELIYEINNNDIYLHPLSAHAVSLPGSGRSALVAGGSRTETCLPIAASSSFAPSLFNEGAIFRSSSAAFLFSVRSSSSFRQTPEAAASKTGICSFVLANSLSCVSMTLGIRSSAFRKFWQASFGSAARRPLLT